MTTETNEASEAYRRLSKKLHPDAGGDNEDMRDLNAINDVAKKFKFSFEKKAQDSAEVEVDSRQEAATKPSADVWAGVKQYSQNEMDAINALMSMHPLKSILDIRVSEPQRQRDAACELVQGKIRKAVSGGWTEDAEAGYQRGLANARDYWKKFATPDADCSAENINARLKNLWVAGKVGCGWSQELLLMTVKALEI